MFDAFKITYYEDLPDSVFRVQIPGNPAYVEKPLTIPEENIGILSNPGHGISAEGLTPQEAGKNWEAGMPEYPDKFKHGLGNKTTMLAAQGGYHESRFEAVRRLGAYDPSVRQLRAEVRWPSTDDSDHENGESRRAGHR